MLSSFFLIIPVTLTGDTAAANSSLGIEVTVIVSLGQR